MQTTTVLQGSKVVARRGDTERFTVYANAAGYFTARCSGDSLPTPRAGFLPIVKVHREPTMENIRAAYRACLPVWGRLFAEAAA
ncbi:MAG TPA: hypothetical protein VKU80_17180 [Planctomycetota bacterium]|nr:hypothetical protein [Planctomycetota bacterium]